MVVPAAVGEIGGCRQVTSQSSRVSWAGIQKPTNQPKKKNVTPPKNLAAAPSPTDAPAIAPGAVEGSLPPAKSLEAGWSWSED